MTLKTIPLNLPPVTVQRLLSLIDQMPHGQARQSGLAADADLIRTQVDLAVQAEKKAPEDAPRE